ncbi:MAG TPA: transcription elongation factor GreA [Candidatus Paceibacterota bacterium]|nr:transcription elongation factor GreA [Candidatus Paceibacterota bacterium]HRY76776.1 transcription elongation factor GreA [Candidatus Paceibacterota bacterium]
MNKVYLTNEKEKELRAELKDRQTNQRLEIGERLKRAKEHGDLSENADYAAAKEIQLANENRILELESILGSAEIIKNGAKGISGEIAVGSKVRVSGPGGIKEFTILGSYDSDPKQNLISNESPLGKAFLGRKIGEEVEVQTPAGLMKYKIVSVE